MDAIDSVLPPRERVTLDFTSCRSVSALYFEMRTKMAWDDEYGENLDALWDILTGLPYRGDDFTILRLCAYPADSGPGLGGYVDKIISLFRLAEAEQSLSVEVVYFDHLPE